MLNVSPFHLLKSECKIINIVTFKVMELTAVVEAFYQKHDPDLVSFPFPYSSKHTHTPPHVHTSQNNEMHSLRYYVSRMLLLRTIKLMAFPFM